MQTGKQFAMMFQLIGAVQLRSQRRFDAVWRLSRLRPASRIPFASYVFGNHEKLASRLQRSAGVICMVEQPDRHVCTVSHTGCGARSDHDHRGGVRQRTECGGKAEQDYATAAAFGFPPPRDSTDPENEIMQSDQHTTHHPVPSRSAEYAPASGGRGDAAKGNGHEKSKDSADRHDAITPKGRRPARSAENKTRTRR
jgi:hypothetical protein